MALEDANKAIEWDKDYIKAYYRRACANLCLLKLDDAMKDFQELIKLFPNDPKLIENINKTKKQIKKNTFRNIFSYSNDNNNNKNDNEKKCYKFKFR